jgi:hypothetical protein
MLFILKDVSFAQKTSEESAPVEIFVTDQHKYPGQVLKMTLLNEGAIYPDHVQKVPKELIPEPGDKKHNSGKLSFKKTSLQKCKSWRQRATLILVIYGHLNCNQEIFQKPATYDIITFYSTGICQNRADVHLLVQRRLAAADPVQFLS